MAEELKECFGCGDNVAKYHRVDDGNGFCTKCYARLFKKRICPGCSDQARLPDRKEAVCRKCQYHGLPCVRCGTEKFEIGKITNYGPVCNSCSPYFRIRRPCPRCGELSSRLSKVSRLEIEESVCPKCQRADYGSCSACNRHRLLSTVNDGRKLCKPCAEKGMMPCSSCGNSMPAGYGKTCKDCYFSSLLKKRIGLNCAGFNSKEVENLFREFGTWLATKTGDQKAAITINKYNDFFLNLEREWGMVPSYQVLLGRFGSAGLRQWELPMRFLTETSRVTIDLVAKSDDATQRQILDLLSRLPAGSIAQSSLQGYYAHLTERQKVGRTELRSIRLALTPVIGLLQEIIKDSDRHPRQGDLDKFLRRTPGQRASISGYVGFLKRKGIVELKLPTKSNTENNARKKVKKELELELMKLLASGGSGKMYARKLIGTGLAYFHGLPKSSFEKIQHIDIVDELGCEGAICHINGLQFWLPHEFIEVCKNSQLT